MATFSTRLVYLTQKSMMKIWCSSDGFRWLGIYKFISSALGRVLLVWFLWLCKSFVTFSDHFGPSFFFSEKIYEKTIFLIAFYTGSFNSPWPGPDLMDVFVWLLIREFCGVSSPLFIAFICSCCFCFLFLHSRRCFLSSLSFMSLTLFRFFFPHPRSFIR